MPKHTLCHTDELPPEGTALRITANGKALCVAQANGVPCVLEDICMHDQRTSLSEGTVDGTRILCPRHGWAHDLKTGEVPHLPNKSIRVYPVTIQDGLVTIEMD